MLITLFSVAFATWGHRWVAKINGPEELGSYLLYVFLFVIGLPADLWAVVRNVPLLFLFCLIIAVTNLIITLALGKLLRIDLEELLLSVNATLGGAPSAAAMAIAKGWPALILPALLVGIWGYVIGTALGVFRRKMAAADDGSSAFFCLQSPWRYLVNVPGGRSPEAGLWI